jgi:bifunctional UDP-N-acetylglucosamine pyrophosphorylase/glucosamine-1-phosphate N-acetyltransferase
MSSTAVILAAGKSTRMKSRRPKVLHEVCGRPLLHYVLEACYGAGCAKVIVVVGFGKELVQAEFASDKRVVWVEQTEQLGTGHAVRVAEAQLREHQRHSPHGDVFILAGDGPLVRADNLNTLRKAHRDDHSAASLATALVEDPAGYGRIVRDDAGEFLEIVEQLDATPAQREIREINPSIYVARVDELLLALSQLKNENKKGEYYLTDIFGILRGAGKKTLAVQAVAAEDVLSINSREQQAQVDALLQERIQREHRDNGVGIPSGVNVYIESGVTIGPDTTIQPFTFIGRDASIGADCVIGPFASIARGAIVPEGSAVAGNVSAETAALLR